MHLTGDELAAASIAVAALAIAGGYLGVRSANHNALKIAKEERSAQRQDELEALKRTVYVKCLAALLTLSGASMEASGYQGDTLSAMQARVAATKKRLSASYAANNAISELTLIAPLRLRELTTEAFQAASKSTKQDQMAYVRAGAKLSASMRDDLTGTDMPSPAELDRMVDIAVAKLAAKPKAENSDESAAGS